MAHPYKQFRQSNVERSRVAGLTSGYSGGGVTHKGLATNPVKQRASGGAVMDDEPMARRASGGRAKKAGVVVNVISGGQQQPPAPPPMMAPPPPLGPPMPPPSAPPPPGLAGVGMPPPGMPMRTKGGRIYRADGGETMTEDKLKEREPINIKLERPAIKNVTLERPPLRELGAPQRAKGGVVKSVGMKVGTPVEHDKAKTDTDDMKRPGVKMHPKVVTFATGGGVVSFKARGGKVKMDAGTGSGEGRLEQAARTKRNYHGPLK